MGNMATEKLIRASDARAAILRADPKLAYCIDNIKGVDAVEVVRCKDCDWYREHEGGICVNPKCTTSWYGCQVLPEHFCSYGERREGE